MARIYKRENVWYLDIAVNGRRIRRRVGTSKKIAELALRDAEVKAAREEFGFAKKDLSIDKFVELYLDYSRTNHRSSTTTRYKAVIDHFRQFVDHTQAEVSYLSEITPRLLDQYKSYRKNSLVNHKITSDDEVTEHTRRGARSYTINFELGALRTIFNVAVKWGYLKENPSGKVKKLKVEDSKQVRFLSKQECQALLDACPPDLYPYYFLFLHTGMRKAELENLQWSDIDLKRGEIKIQRKPTWQPKTGEREIPMSTQVSEVLKDLKRRKTNLAITDYVFSDKSGLKSKIKLREKLIRIAVKAGVDDLTRIHTLRHTFASHLVMNGVDLPTVKKLMGHSDIETTMIYAHLAPDHMADAVNKLEFWPLSKTHKEVPGGQ